MTAAESHGALMDAVYRHQRHIYDASRKYFLLGRDRLIAGLDVPPGGAVLEVACGTGRNLVRIGQRYPQARLYGFDISRAMLETARGNVARAGMDARVRLAEGDACAFDPQAMFGTAAFDRIVLSYSLSMIPDWERAAAEALRHLAPGGSLWVVDFGTQTGLPGWFRRGLVAWLGKFHVEIRPDLPQALSRAAAAHGGTVTVERPFRDFAVLARVALPAGAAPAD